jgi:predicted phosphodiesterase
MNDNSMKYAILGDIHANLEALEAVLQDANTQQCTHYACLGDIVGYNADPTECLDIVREMAMPCVKGNHDEYSSTDHPLLMLNPRAAAAVIWTRQQLSETNKQWLRELKYIRLVGSFSIVHATLDSPGKWGYVFDKLDAAASFNYQNTAVCFFGHTHLPKTFIRDRVVSGGSYSKFEVESGQKYFVNVGSVGEPRDGDPRAAYVTYNLAEGSIELRRVPYDVEKSEAKLKASGLPARRRSPVGSV